MIPIILINILALILVYLSKNKKSKGLYEVAFILLVFFYGIRCDYGNDYAAYEEVFNAVASSSNVSFLFGGHYEAGWLILNSLFSKTSFHLFVIVLTFFQFFPVYLLLKKYVKPELRFLGLAVFLFSSAFLISLSMMRQALAINVIVMAIPWLEDKKKIPLFILVVILAAQFHTSAYIMLLAPFIMMISKLSNRNASIVYVVLLVLIFSLSSKFESLLSAFSEYEEMERYQGYQSDEQYMTFGVSFITHILFCIAILYKGSDHNQFIRSMYILYPFAYMFTFAAAFAVGIGRLSLYFSALYFVILPNIYTTFKRNGILMIIMALVIILDLWDYVSFFFSPVYATRYAVYHTIFG